MEQREYELAIEFVERFGAHWDQTNQYLERIAMALESQLEQVSSIEFILSNQIPTEHTPGRVVPDQVPVTGPVPAIDDVDPWIERATIAYGEHAEQAMKGEKGRAFLMWALDKGIGRESIVVGPTGSIAADMPIVQRYNHQ